MAKEDFCFTYYDGDAARDMAHMNRLERGAYNDLVISQRKFGHLPLKLLKKTLGNDFDAVWESLEMVLKVDAEQKYFIEWVDKSIEKSREHSKKQKERIDKHWEKVRNAAKNDSTDIPRNNRGTGSEEPLEDGYGNGNGDTKGGAGGKFLVTEMFSAFKNQIKTYPGNIERDYKHLYSIAQFINEQGGAGGSPVNNSEQILEAWRALCLVIKDDSFYCQKSLATISTHIQEITQIGLNGKSKPATTKTTAADRTAARNRHADRYSQASLGG